MRIREVSIHNVNTIGDGKVNFDDLPSLTLVRGKVKGAGASSNGAGKSSIFNAMVWCLYGRELGKRPAGNLIRRGTKECWVEVVLGLDDGKDFRVRRYRRGGSAGVVVNGKNISTATGAQDLIERKIGFTYDLFVRTVVFGGAVSAFCRMSPAERTKILEEMVGIGSLLLASDAAKSKSADLLEEIDELQRVIDDADDRAAELTREVESRQEELTEARTALQKHRKVVQEQAINAYDDLLTVGKSLATASVKYSDAIQAFERETADWTKKYKKLKDHYASIQRVHQSTAHEAAAAERDAVHAARALKNATESKVCPTCNRPLDKAKCDTDSLVKAEKIAKREAESLRASAIADEKREAAAARAVESHEEARPVLKVADDVHRFRGEMTAAYDAYQRGHAEDPAFEARAVSAQKRLKAAQDAADRHGSGVEESEAKLAKLKERQSVYRYWQDGFGRDGIPSLILDAVAPSLNDAVEPIARVMTDGMYSIHFENTVKGSGRSDFRIHVENQEGGNCYEDLSNGERTRTDLCVLFAIRSLMQERSRCRCEQIFVDELADDLDAEGVESMVRLFRSGSLAKQIVYISHDPTIQDAADGVIVVSKSRGVSSLSQSRL